MRIAMLVSTSLDPTLPVKIQQDLHPQQDFLALSEVLGARLITPFEASSRAGGRASRAVNIFRSAWAAFHQRSKYDLIISDMDRAGATLALLFKLTRTRKRHIVICHGKIINPYDIRLLSRLKLQEYIDCFVCYGPAVAAKLKSALELPDSRVVTVRHAADHHFWRPMSPPTDKLIVSAGMLHRDYPTLMEAVLGQDASLTIAAHSPWVTGRQTTVQSHALPPNARVTRCDYWQLRELYSQALCVAIPLTSSDSQSGSLVMYEAMSMGKPVLITRTRGQDGLSVIEEGKTGYYLEPGDVTGWRERINYLCAHPQVAKRMGQRSREVVEGGMNLDSYVSDMASLVQAVASQDQPPGRHRKDTAAASILENGR